MVLLEIRKQLKTHAEEGVKIQTKLNGLLIEKGNLLKQTVNNTKAVSYNERKQLDNKRQLFNLQLELNKGINEEEALFGPNRLNADDPVLQPWLSRASTQLEDAVRIVTGMFDPPVIVLGGLLPHDYLKDIAKRLTASNVKGPSRGLSVATVIATSQGDLNGPIGAASIPFFRLFFPGSKA